MSQMIDERVVEMQFDNGQFEKAARQTIGTISGIHDEIDGLEESAKAFNKTNLKVSGLGVDALSSAIARVSNSFSSMEIIGVAALTRITNKAMETGEQMIKALTIDPIKTGLSEYEEKIDNIQTTLVNSGADLSVVNDVLDEMNRYADKTIYKFSDMTTAIGKFTIAGIGLDEAKYAIEGIGNAAAMSGLKASQASSAYYMISQAYQSGVMTLYQFRTLENSGFASKAFREHVMDAAVKMGTLKKTADGAYETLKGNEVTLENLRNTLDEKWLTKDVLQYTFLEYADATTEFGKQALAAAQEVKTASQLWDTLKEAAQSGWSKNWEYIIGDFYQAKELWTGINDVISNALGTMYDSQAKVLEYWNKFGGRADTIKALSNSFWSLAYALKPIKEAFGEVFPKLTGVKLNEFSRKLLNWSKGLQLTDFAIDRIYRTFKGIFSIFDSAKTIFSQAVSHIKDFMQNFAWLPSKVLNLTAYIGDLLMQFNQFVHETDIFANTSSTLKTAFSDFKNGLGKFFKTVSDNVDQYTGISKIGFIIKEALFSSLDGLTYIFDKLFGIDISNGIALIKERILELIEIVKPFVEVLDGFVPELSDLFKFDNSEWETLTFAEKFAKVLEILSTAAFRVASAIFKIGNALTSGIMDALKELKFGEIIKYIASGALVTSIASLIAQISNLLDPLADFGDMINNIREDLVIQMKGRTANAIKNLGIAIGIVAASLYVMSKIDPQGFAQALIGLITVVAILLEAQQLMKSTAKSFKSGGAITEMWGAVDSLTSKWNMSTVAVAIVSFASAIGILALALKQIASIDDMGKMWQAFGAIEAFLVTFTGIIAILSKLQSTDKIKGTFTKGLSGLFLSTENEISNISKLGSVLVKMAAAIAILVIPIKLLGEMDFSNLVQGGIAVGGLILAFGVFGALTKDLDLKTTSGALVKFAASVLVLVWAVKSLSTIEQSPLLDAVIALGALFGAFYAFVFFTQNMGNVESAAKGLLLYSAALLIMSSAIKNMSKVSDSLTALSSAGTLGILMSIFGLIAARVDPNKAIGTATALTIFSSALLIMSIPLRLLGSLGSSVWNGVIALTALLGEVAILSEIIEPLKMHAVATGLLLFGSAITLLSADLIILSQLDFGSALSGLLLLAGAIAAIAFGSSALLGTVPAITAMGAALITFGLGAALISASVFLLCAAFYLLVEALGTVSEAAGKFARAFIEIVEIISESDVITELGSAFSQTFVGGFLKKLENLAPAVAEGIVDMLQTAVEMVTPAVEFVLDAANWFMNGITFGTWKPMQETLAGVISDIRNGSDEVVEATEEMAESTSQTVEDIANKTEKETEKTASKTGEFFSKLWDWISKDGTADEKMSGINSLFTEMGSSLKDSVLGIASESGIMDSLKDEAGGLSDELEKLVKNAVGLGDSTDDTKSKLESITKTIKEQTNVLKKFDLTANITAQDMLDNMASNVTAMHEWSSNLSRLAKRGLNQEIIDYLASKGTSSYAEVGAFAQMTDEQIKEANNLWVLNNNAMDLAANQAADSIKYSTEVAAKGVSDALNAYYGAVDSVGLANSTLEDVSAAIKYNQDVVEAARKKAEETKEAVKKVFTKQEVQEIGNYAIDGIYAGMNKNFSKVYKNIEMFGYKGMQVVKDVWDINSPSREFAKLGEYAILGVAMGMSDAEDNTLNTVDLIASNTVKAMEDALYLMETNNELEPVIRPVMDLSEIQNGASSMNSMLSSNQALMASVGYQANLNMARENERAMQLNAIQSAVDSVGESIVNAIISASDREIGINVSVTPDSSGLFKMVRAENTKFRRANGYNAFA